MKRLVTVIAALLSCIVMSAQDIKVKSRVELKGGKADIVGYAALQDDGGYVVETDAGDVFYYSAAEIKKVTPLESKPVKEDKVKEPKVKEKKTLSYDFSGDRSKTSGYMGIVEGGVGWAAYDLYITGDWSAASSGFAFSTTVINGYRFSPHIYAGIGVELNGDMSEGVSFPIYAHLRTEFTKKRIAPYLALSAGPIMSNYYSEVGFFCEAALGVRSHCRKHGSLWTGLALDITRQMDWGDYYRRAPISDYQYTYFSAHGIVIKFKVGYSF